MHPARDVPLDSLNTLALRARAAALVAVPDDGALGQALAWARAQGLPVMPLGQGSNVVLAGDIEALVVRQASTGARLLGEEGDWARLRVAAGQDWHTLVEWTLGQGLYGLENLALIPGTAGAAPIQNIGAYGVELAPFVECVHALSIEDGQAMAMTREECEFGYRDSAFKHRWRDQLVITALDLKLSRVPEVRADYPALAAHLAASDSPEVTPRVVFEAVVAIRRSKLPDPARIPNAGSFFKNPVLDAQHGQHLQQRFPELPVYAQPDGRVKLPAAWLIDHCGWKGRRVGGVGVHPEHALVLANYGADSGERLLQLAAEIAASVAECFGVELAIEPRVYGRAA